MDSFYLTVASIAVIILILMLTYVGVLLFFTKSSDVYPPMRNQCPDYWKLDDNGKCIFPKVLSSKNRGQLKTVANYDWKIAGTETRLFETPNPIVTTDSTKEISSFNMDSPKWDNLYGKKGELCNKKYWAVLNKISWDGVSNTNQC